MSDFDDSLEQTVTEKTLAVQSTAARLALRLLEAETAFDAALPAQKTQAARTVKAARRALLEFWQPAHAGQSRAWHAAEARAVC